ncbi:amidohydrolase [Xylariaceae sp. FL1272]|nr:amidohydrolase [Xylariaceae sp. FL1272]
MDHEKSGLPPYSAVAGSARPRQHRAMRRSKGLRVIALACLAFIVYAQWRQISSPQPNASPLSVERLEGDLKLCSKLQSKPKDPIGAGRDRNARYRDGHEPTLIKNATIWVGEPATGTSEDDARMGKGFSWISGDVLLEHGLIKQVGDIDENALSPDTIVWNAQGRRLTTGIIDMHSHSGVYDIPQLEGNGDTNEMSSDITPFVRSIDGLNPLDHQIQVIKSGGVTTSLVLPGSDAVGNADGRNETSIMDMFADPDRNWRYIKMACGENPKRVSRSRKSGPVSRLGEAWEFRHAFEEAANLVRAQDDWCSTATAIGAENMDSYLPQDLKWETLGAVLRGQVHVNTHCYTIPDLESFVSHTNEFKFAIRAFHHAHQTYLVPEVLKRAWGDSPPASALFADNMWYKAESYIGSEYAGKILYENGLTPIYVSDNPVINAQHVVFEAAKAFGYGLPYHAALASVTTAPAERLGFEHRLGKIKPGFDADVVVWDSDPLSVGAAPVQVWIDGTAQYEDPVELKKPFEARIDVPKDIRITSDEPVSAVTVIVTGISKSFFTSEVHNQVEGTSNLTAIISNGKVNCLGDCTEESIAAQRIDARTLSLNNGYITKPFTAFGAHLGLQEIDAESDTGNGGGPEIFSRGVDGLALDTKKIHYAHKYGVTRAISGPSYLGTSAGFRTGAKHTLEKGAVFVDDAALHYTLDLSVKNDKTSISSAVGSLRKKLLDAIDGETPKDGFSEAAFLSKVVDGSLALAIKVQSADTIASLLQVKNMVDKAITSANGGSGIKLVIIGGAESFIVADELAAANVGVVLSPLLSYRSRWDERRALTGAPLTNGTAIDILVEAGVTVAIGLEEDWLVRDMALLAGIAYKNGEGEIGEEQALDFVGSNVYKMLGLESEESGDFDEFVIFEGNPLEIGSHVRAVGNGLGKVSIYEYEQF